MLADERVSIDGTVLREGTIINLKTMPASFAYRELEALARLSWFRRNEITEVYPEVYGLVMHYLSAYLFDGIHFIDDLKEMFTDEPMVTIEFEWVDAVFTQLGFNA